MAKKMQELKMRKQKCLDCPRDSAAEAICGFTAFFTTAMQGNMCDSIPTE